MAKAKSKVTKERTITFSQASKVERENTRRFLNYLQQKISDDLVKIYDGNLTEALVSYGRLSSINDLLNGLEEETGRDHTVDFMVRIRDN